jgi:ribosome-interacting GTPase 1
VRQCHSIHKTIVDDFKHAVVYGKSVKHQPQRVGLSHELADEDISKSDGRGSRILVVPVANITSSYYN